MRSFDSEFGSKDFLQGIQKGVMNYTYRGIKCLKNPFDISIYLKLISEMRPGCIIEIGTNEGGSALLFNDLVKMLGIQCSIYSIDINNSIDYALGDRITFLNGDVRCLGKILDNNFFQKLNSPILVIEDSSHKYSDVLACLTFFSNHLKKGDMIVIEDGILSELGLDEKYEGGPNRALKEYFELHPDIYQIATDYCDMFGKNISYNPNGYLWKL